MLRSPRRVVPSSGFDPGSHSSGTSVKAMMKQKLLNKICKLLSRGRTPSFSFCTLKLLGFIKALPTVPQRDKIGNLVVTAGAIKEHHNPSYSTTPFSKVCHPGTPSVQDTCTKDLVKRFPLEV
jgi:hypothetical protein